MEVKKNILVAPLNWGLGHATRCIPIIRALIENGFNPIIASDGDALGLLKKEFPHTKAIRLPSYDIKYAKKGKNFKQKMFFNSPKILLAIIQEHLVLKRIIKDYRINGIISDNRFGLFSKKIPCVYITHQLTVLSGKTTNLSSNIHHYFIKKYDSCWVPDLKQCNNLSGKLGHLNENHKLNIEYIGPLSRFEKKSIEKKYDLMVLLSGPEPQRTILEKKLFNILKTTNKKTLFVRGKVDSAPDSFDFGNITFYNYMTSNELESAINASELIIARSGYTTIMDLAKLEKKAFFIPTPGQSEQEYLAKRMDYLGLTPYSKQENLSLEKLNKVLLYSGLKNFNSSINYQKLFNIFDEKKTTFYSSVKELEVLSKVKENSEPTPTSLST
ncbi:glycosyltransferase [Pseudofulvibacter geojedonensis]|uniref:Glycosyltransferase n=1 Tax=Pseudofulvibacter geojedonensis TaxID=1123758 RepID=A0ABW3I3N1_9FLAO